jgi:hypothetical protein
MLAGCSNEPGAPDTGYPLGDRTFTEVCTDYCILGAALCGWWGGRAWDCEPVCATQLRDAQLYCEREAAARRACWLDALVRDGCAYNSYKPHGREPCEAEWYAEYNCLATHACTSTHTCVPDGDTCECYKLCQGKTGVKAECTASSGGAYCNCYVDSALVGSCEQPTLDCYVTTSCCAAYFDF